ncbi:threonine-phosphate decarboxylase CobD [Kaistia geumhonensis]|uniref:threonine-phosphate decarboxylase n=1 Tax=Kaistia geumhonensis TaxID=410839 RepID=A0ABU0M3A1_9HYPH|nr:threonine-phosphate decarboxylase CobD [Kaistia geumhonensis]MCX5479356.1 threonine-phosphate decarboxylase CobD [Kaistia geumhonensis]MDQ0515421.1 cobalamin biosynthetic protein CobC [Kaistia geumhonensis]
MTRDTLPSDDRHAEPRHGGALAAATARYGFPAGGWLDLSTGINPEPWPAPAPTVEAYARLPDPADLASLMKAARSTYGAPAQALLVAVPGSDVALRLLPSLAPCGTVAVLSPTYSGHAEAWRGAGHAVRAISALNDAAGSDVVVLANPNNPDGRVTAPADILRVLAALPAKGLLVVDEAFADLTPEISIVPALGDPRLVVLRSFGKFYGLAGLRLGFVLGSGAIVERLAALMGDWPVSGPALAVGRAALSDTGWRDATRLRLAERRRRLDLVLARHSLAIAGGTDLFRLIGVADAGALHERLARRGVWTRVFAERPGFIRFGIPRDADLDRLDAALGR